MTLTQNDYRAAVLQAYRAFRLSPSKPSTQSAYLLAKGIIKPLPDEKIDAIIRVAFNEYARSKRADPEEHQFRAHAIWLACYRYAREYLNP
jgi:hypothetical protein